MNLFLLQLHYLGTGENKKVGLLEVVIWVFSTFSHLDFRGSSSEGKSLLSLELRHRWKQKHNTVCLCQRLCTISAHNNMDRHALKTLTSQNITSSVLFIFFPRIYSKVSENSPQGISLSVLQRIREDFAMTKTSFSTREGFALSEQSQALRQQVPPLPIPLISFSSAGKPPGAV